MNDAQIKKLQAKVARELEARKKKEEAANEKVRAAILTRLRLIENTHPGRGKCVCFWEGSYWHEHNGALFHNLDLTADMVRENFDVVPVISLEIPSDVSFYILSQEACAETAQLIGWMEKNYATIKIAMASKKEKTLVSCYTLGGIVQDFQSKFPQKSINDLAVLIKEMDKIIQGKISSLSDR